MKPAEQAKELFDSYFLTVTNYWVQDPKELAKECCLDCVDQIIKFMMMDDELHNDCHMANTEWPRYWIEVKKEIGKL